MVKKYGLITVLAILVLAANFALAGTVELTQLRCEYRVNPAGIDTSQPRLSWILESSDRDQKQTAYRILVASSEAKLAAEIGDLWDTKKMISDQSIQVVYAGRRLKSRMRCYWKVRIWDRNGAASVWSEPARWSMGLLNTSDWKATWISHDTSMLNENSKLHLPPCAYFRKQFEISTKINRATVYVSALGLFEVYINGVRVGRDYFTPGWTNYHKRVYYLTYDVTHLLKEGNNAIGSILAPGWYAGYVGFVPPHQKNRKRRAFYGEIPALLVQLEIEYETKKIETIATDQTWNAFTGPIRESDILMGETYDARLEIPGWNQAGFNDPEWNSVKLMDPGNIKIEAYPAEPVQVMREIRPIEMTQPQKDVFVFNLGQNFAGRVRLKVKGSSGKRVTLRFAEMLHTNGMIMTENLRNARSTDTYILKGTDTEEIWEPHFTYHGFQFVEVRGFPGEPDLDAITGIVLHTANSPAGSFETSDSMVNRLYSNIIWSQRSNFFDIPTDCPQRDERLGWSGDAQIYIRSATYNMDIAAFFTKWLISLEDDQRPSGAFPDYAPMPFLLFEPSAGWMDAGIICPYTIYKVYGDTRIINNHYRAMAKFMDFLIKNSTNYLRSPAGNSWGDWLSIDEKTPKDLIATAYFAYDAKLMAEMAAAIGWVSESCGYTELFEKIKKAFNQAYVSANGRILGDTQTCYALALYMNLLPENLKIKASARLLELIGERNWHLTTGFLGTRHLLPVLTEFGYAEIAYRLLTNKTYPSWGYSIENGATTIWERWNGFTKTKGFENPDMNSFNHYAFGSVCEWLFAYMAGIDSDRPGFKKINLRPALGAGDITHVSAIYHSMYGPIKSGWKIIKNRFILDVTIPPNTTATVYIPTQDIAAVTEGGRPAVDAEKVEFLRMQGNKAVFAVGSGRYRFSSFLPPRKAERAIKAATRASTKNTWLYETVSD